MIRWLLASMMLIMFYGITYGQSLLVSLESKDKRFSPVDAVHATCKQSVQLTIDTPEPLAQVSLMIGYNTMQMTMIGWERNQFSSSQAIIADSRLMYEVSSLISSGKTVLTYLSFESLSGARTISLQLQTGSYITTSKQVKKMLTPKTYEFAVSTVPECDPDITPPRIQLVSPSSVSERVLPNMPLQFRIIDTGKGVDRSRVFVEMGGLRYTQKTQGTVISGDIISIRPRGGVPYNTGLMVRVAASDLQVYGGSNNVVEQYALKTAVEPAQCRMMGCTVGTGIQQIISQEVIRRELSPDQCRLLATHVIDGMVISGFIRQIGCDPSMMNKTTPSWGLDGGDSQTILMILGWGLFGCSMLLALLYSRDYRKLQKRQREVLFRT